MKKYLAVMILVLSFAGTGHTAENGKPLCLTCHDSGMVRPELRKIPEEWRQSWHFQNAVACNDCHGGDPEEASMEAMSPARGFVGAPAYQAVPEFCGKCHVGILKNYLASGHGKALKASGSGPNCVTCHGSHGIRKAAIEIINEQRCSQCHSYERAGIIKDALSSTEQRMGDLEKDLKKLAAQGMYVEQEDRELFRTMAEFRTLFHTVDVSLVRQKTAGFNGQLDAIRKKTDRLFSELKSRRDYASVLLLLFAGSGVIACLIAKTYR